jgi:integrase
MVRQHKARLKLAGIPYQTDDGFADFHSLRKSINTRLRKKGVLLRLRQRFLRHAAADLATTAYDDERLNELTGLRVGNAPIICLAHLTGYEQTYRKC